MESLPHIKIIEDSRKGCSLQPPLTEDEARKVLAFNAMEIGPDEHRSANNIATACVLGSEVVLQFVNGLRAGGSEATSQASVSALTPSE